MLLWRDFLEIGFLSSLVYCFSVWLKKDKKRNLLPALYGYCGIIFAAHMLQLTTITVFLFITSPVALMLFILFHQELLQRNFVTLSKQTVDTITEKEWLGILLRTCLVAINKNKELHFVIENTNDLKTMLKAPFFLRSATNQQLLEFLIESPCFDNQHLIWLNTQGSLIAVNAIWEFNTHEAWQSTPVKELASWQQDALLMTLKTDALVCKSDPIKRAFDIIIAGKVYESLSAPHALSLIKKYLYKNVTKTGAVYHDTISERKSVQQHNT